MSDAEPKAVEPVVAPKVVRIVMVWNTPLSPNRLYYTKDMTYDILEDDALWVLDNGFGYKEGDTPIDPPEVVAKRAEQEKVKAEAAASRAALKAARDRAKIERAAKLAQAKQEQEARKQALLAARAKAKAERATKLKGNK